jgi:hypothetical protein
LIESKWADVHGHDLVLTDACNFVAREIVAIEAKVAHPKRALRQAFLNTWFASRSVVLFGADALATAANEEAKQLGLGVWVFHNHNLTIRLRGVAAKQPRSYASWYFDIHASVLQHSLISGQSAPS